MRIVVSECAQPSLPREQGPDNIIEGQGNRCRQRKVHQWMGQITKR
jgi:hypothetical protein